MHHHYRLVEQTTGSVFEESIEIHTIELSKYNGTIDSVRVAGVLDQWCYWIKNAEEELQKLLPSLAFLHATSELREICEITEEKEMYDSREKAILGYESNLIDAREEGETIGLEKGQAIGRIQLIQELLGDVVANEDSLRLVSLEQLTSTMQSLQAKLRERNA